MNLDGLTALIVAVAGILTGLSGLFKILGDKRKASIDEWKEISDNYKKDYRLLSDRFNQLEKRIEDNEKNHEIERKAWKEERENMIQVNEELSIRIDVLEKALIEQGVDVDEL